MAEFNILLIGCGNIGALYDFQNDEILTHAKALNHHNLKSVFIYDTNSDLLQKVSQKYSFKIINNIDDISFDLFKIVIISSPTFTHYDLLLKCFYDQVPIIICEKPIELDKEKLIKIIESSKTSKSVVYINYIRRFQPEFIKLKKFIKENIEKKSLKNISINYKRGYFNNCSHALDLIQFLLDDEINLENIHLINSINDTFNDDPTIQMCGTWNDAGIYLNGISNIELNIFEIHFYFNEWVIHIEKSGNLINITGNSGVEMRIDGAIKDYMKNVYSEILNGQSQSNFKTSANLILKMINWIDK